MLSDTVGFVRDLPHKLVASFKATLEEAVHADLLLHVLDVGHPHAEQQYKSVHQVLEEIGAKGKPEILLLNKIDTDDGAAQYPTWRALHAGTGAGAIPVSARTGQGVADLHDAVVNYVRGQQIEVELEIASTNGKLLAFLESRCRIEDRQFEDNKVRLKAIVGRNFMKDLLANEDITILRQK
jgi:GTP-binding protein HflX